MNGRQARTEAKRLAKEGMKYAEIAAKLTEGGYRTRSGKEVSPGGVSNLLLAAGVRRRNSAAATAAASGDEKTPKKGRLGAVRKVLELSDMDAEEKVTLALLLLEGAE